jgi:hypothetical protein
VRRAARPLSALQKSYRTAGELPAVGSYHLSAPDGEGAHKISIPREHIMRSGTLLVVDKFLTATKRHETCFVSGTGSVRRHCTDFGLRTRCGARVFLNLIGFRSLNSPHGTSGDNIDGRKQFN